MFLYLYPYLAHFSIESEFSSWLPLRKRKKNHQMTKKNQETSINEETIQSDDSKLEVIDIELNQSDSETKHIKSVLTASKSMPMFDTVTRNESDESDYGSESDLQNVTINETSLLFSQSCQPNGEKNKPNGQHKVKFVELENRRKYSDTQSCKDQVEINFRKFSPKRNGKIQSPSLCGKSSSKKKRRCRQISETSSVSMTSVNSSSSTNTNYSVVAPDGGYGWVVVAASFFVNMIADGVTFSFGIMFEQFQDEFGSSSAATAGVVSMFHAVPLMTGPIATWLTDRQR